MIIGYTMLHYGIDYLAYALESLRPFVDRHVILYSEAPTFGNYSQFPCPDSRDALWGIAHGVLGSKLDWRENMPQNYQTIIDLYPDAELILEIDADEVMSPALIGDILRRYRSEQLSVQRYRLPMVHHWRSFNYICRDASWPVRLCVPGNAEGEGFYPSVPSFMHHFGYARSCADMQYKIETSVHRPEWRQEWWTDTFLRFPERLTDLHPVSVGLWNAEPYDRLNLPAVLHHHPYWDKEVIE